MAIKLMLPLFAFTIVAQAAEFHVAITGNDANPGTKQLPFRTIQHAADAAQPGDVVTVQAGVYRERVDPPRGGASDSRRIVYRSAPGEKVTITGSEPMKGWEKVSGDTWKVAIPNHFFGMFNPYSDLIHGDWFKDNGRHHHTGCVYLNSDWLIEAARFEDVFEPVGKVPLWFGKVDHDTTTLWAQFPGVNPNEANVEINVRQTVFTPEKTGVTFITVRGFDLRNAATPWAPPSAGQFGVISAYWCKGWIIENNEISYSKCSGVALGKYSDKFDNTNDNGRAAPYTDCVRRALTNGWNKATVGGHIVRNNHIHHCEQTGIVGSLGCAYSSVTDNEIHDIHVHQLFAGWEQAGIKFHGAIDVVISHNHIYRCGGKAGIWLDWMAQGAQVTGNLLHNNFGPNGDIYLEMQHGPTLVANNLLLSQPASVCMNAQGMAFAHNLMAGPIRVQFGDKRTTPFQECHSTSLAGFHCATNGDSGDYRFYNNLFTASCNLAVIDKSALPCHAAGNVFTKGTQPSKFDAAALAATNFNADIKLQQKPDGWYLALAEDKAWRAEAKRQTVTTELLGKARMSDCAYENPDGSPLIISTDYFGTKRDWKNPFPGPFETAMDGKRQFKVWPR
jgi:alpha-N-arabinofuranosidase